MADERSDSGEFTDTRTDSSPTPPEVPTADEPSTATDTDSGSSPVSFDPPATSESPAETPTAEVSDPAAPETTTDDGTPIWQDVSDSNAGESDTPVPTAPDPVPAVTPQEPTTADTPVVATEPGVDTVPDSPVAVPEVPPVAVVDEDAPKVDRLYNLEESGVPDPNQPLFSGDEVPFLLEFLANRFGEEFILAKIRFMLRSNHERDENPDYRK